MHSKFRKRGGFAIALALLLVFIGIASVIPLRRGYTRQYSSPDSIAALEQITLGGSPQWVLIRGANRNNPLLLFLHGGPGMPMMYLSHDFQRELEQNFVVVQWDRRGAGKSFAAGLSGPDMTVSREIEDTIELIEHLRSRFHQEKIYLVGFSYGSYLGILVAQRAPELLHAYVGIGQMACSNQESRALQDAWIREEATRSGDNAALDELNGRKPLDREKWLFKYGAEIHFAHNWLPLLWSGLRSPEYTFQDVFNVKKGVDFTAGKLRYDVINGSILENVSALQIPMYFFTGRFDYTDPTPCTVRLFDKLSAPAKKIIWFEHSAHFVFLDEPSRFATEMRRVVQETASH